MKASQLYIAQVKREFGLIERVLDEKGTDLY